MGSTHNPLFMSGNMYVYIVWWMESSLLRRGDTQSPLILTPPPHLTYLEASNPRIIMVYMIGNRIRNDGNKDLGR